MDVAEHLAFLQREGDLLATAASHVDPDTPVTTVPDWPLRDLVRHVGGIHRWATATIRDARTERYDATLIEVVGQWPDDRNLVEWFREGHAGLVQTLRANADPDLDCWHFFDAPTAIAFWARRQTHETAIHRADAQSCSGPISPYDAELAADGIDEILFGFAARKGRYPESPMRMELRATDVGREWRATLGPERVVVEADGDRDGDGSPDCTVAASASDLYLLLWNRMSAEAIPVLGDPATLSLWRDAVRVRWSE